MVGKKTLIIFLISIVAVLFISLVSATGDLSFSPAAINEEFDFVGENLTIGNSGGENITKIVNISRIRNGTTTYLVEEDSLNYEHTFTFDMSEEDLESGDILFFEVFNESDETLLDEVNITLNPQAPTVGTLAISGTGILNQKIIETQRPVLSITVSDDSGIETVTADIRENVQGGSFWDDESFTDADEDGVFEASAINISEDHNGRYNVTFNATDIYGNSQIYETYFTVYELLASNSTIENKFDGIDDADFSLAEVEGVSLFGVDLVYTFTFESDNGYDIKGVDVTFIDTTALDISTDNSVNIAADDIDFVSEISKSFEFTFEDHVGQICFDDISPDNKKFVLYCSVSADDVDDCESWSSYPIGDDGCTSAADVKLESVFAAGTCKAANWCEGHCYKELDDANQCLDEDEDEEESGSSEESSSDESEVISVKDETKTIGVEETNSTLLNKTANNSNFLTGFGNFLVDNKGTSVPIGIAVVVLLGLIAFIVVRKGVGSKTEIGSSVKGKKVSVHALTKKHDLNKPSDPKDETKLKDFVDVAMMMGHKANDLRDALKYRGWDPKLVDSVFKKSSFKDAKK